MKGQIIYLPKSKVTVVPFEQSGRDTWTCCVVASEHDSYPRGGYNISVTAQELEDGLRLKLCRAAADGSVWQVSVEAVGQ